MSDCASNLATLSGGSALDVATRSTLATLSARSTLDACVPTYVPETPTGYGFGLGPFGGPSNPFGGTP